LGHFAPDAPKNISCDEGWWILIANCHKEITAIDPDYTIFQIKEKFGGLRYYYSPSNPIHTPQINEVVSKYEKICSMTCEVTGRHGYLMRKGQRGLGLLKTLNEDFMNDGWERVENNNAVVVDNNFQGK